MKKLIFTLFILVAATLGTATESGRQTLWLFDENMTYEEMVAHVENLEKSGVNCVIFGGGNHHYLFNSDDAALTEYLTKAAEAVRLCHNKNIKVIEHHSNTLISPEKCTDALELILLRGFEQNADSGIWPEYGTRSFCPNNLSYRKMYLEKVKIILDAVPFDGIMSDDASFHAGCSCLVCREKWSTENGGDLVAAYHESQQKGSAMWTLWNQTRKRWMRDFYLDIHQSISRDYPKLIHFVLANDSLSPWPSQINGLYPELYAETGDLIVWEIYNPSDFYSFRRLASSAAVYRAMCESPENKAMAFAILPYADHAENRDVFERNEELFMWAFSMTVGGDFCFGRVFLTGLSPTDTPEDFFNFERRHLADRKTWGRAYANIGVLFSPADRDADPEWEKNHTAHFLTAMEYLQSSGIPAIAVIANSPQITSELTDIIIPNSSSADLTIFKKLNINIHNLSFPPNSHIDNIYELAAFPVCSGLSIKKDFAKTFRSSIRLLTDGEAPLFRVYKNDATNTITIPMANTLGGQLPPNSIVPRPTSVTWGLPVPLKFELDQEIISASLLTYPDGNELNIPFEKNSVSLNSPNFFQVLKLKVKNMKNK